MKARFLWLAAWLACLPAVPVHAGEIIIVQPEAAQGSRTDQEAARAKDKARQKAGKAGSGTTIIITDQPADSRGPSQAEKATQEARDYMRGAPVAGDTGDGTTIILRAAPSSDAERARLKARSYTTQGAAHPKECSTVTSEVGTIGEGPGATKGSVLEKGTSSVSVQTCR